MRIANRLCTLALLLGGLGAMPVTHAKLPPLTPEQQQAAAAKKAQADAEAEKAKKDLAASMDAVASRWRERAGENGWKTYPAVSTDPIQGMNASANQSSPSGQPSGQLGAAAKEAPVRSEKLGTAPASQDTKPDAKPPAAK
jgi:hypothetical protein